MKIHIFDNLDGTYHIGIQDSVGYSDTTCASWEEVVQLLASLKAPKIVRELNNPTPITAATALTKAYSYWSVLRQRKSLCEKLYRDSVNRCLVAENSLGRLICGDGAQPGETFVLILDNQLLNCEVETNHNYNITTRP